MEQTTTATVQREHPDNNRLKLKNGHERDKNIQFYEEGHIYDINGDRSFTSVTSIVSQFYEHFNADKIIDKILKKNSDPSHKYYNMTKEEIKKMWDDNRDDAATKGTIMHFNIESYYNENTVDYSLIEIKHHFSNYQRNFVEPRKWVPYRTEMLVYDEDIKISGSIDMLYKVSETNDQELVIADWKRTKELQKENRFQNMKSPFDHFPDTNYYHYCLQLNIYCYILETKYNKRIKEMYLVALHENNADYIVEFVPRFSEEIKDLIEKRKAFLLKNQSSS